MLKEKISDWNLAEIVEFSYSHIVTNEKIYNVLRKDFKLKYKTSVRHFVFPLFIKFFVLGKNETAWQTEKKSKPFYKYKVKALVIGIISV